MVCIEKNTLWSKRCVLNTWLLNPDLKFWYWNGKSIWKNKWNKVDPHTTMSFSWVGLHKLYTPSVIVFSFLTKFQITTCLWVCAHRRLIKLSFVGLVLFKNCQISQISNFVNMSGGCLYWFWGNLANTTGKFINIRYLDASHWYGKNLNPL